VIKEKYLYAILYTVTSEGVKTWAIIKFDVESTIIEDICGIKNKKPNPTKFLDCLKSINLKDGLYTLYFLPKSTSVAITRTNKGHPDKVKHKINKE
jgi:hypothetical protein